MSKPHILVIPYPAQGHVIPLMELSNELVKHGIKVTFVNTDFTHKRIMKALQEKCVVGNEIQLVSIPDGLQDGDDRNDLGKLTEALFEVMPKKLEMLIEEINKSLSNKITCIVADGNLGWALEVSKKMGIRTVAFWPASASLLILFFSLQKLIDDGTIDSDGLRLDRNSGIITREDITYKIKQLLHDEEFQIRALKLKESAINSVKEGGSSNKNFKNFIDWIKACV
ncbi:hypothetical protein TanjilG_14501 [Lupinus angustifolius]|uniref:Uncharacterized protein n=1 Tax=Lupinus angustifolius TaxID=3871 RepID=A0A4P1RSG3_LUPAN|nr:hypothetical protein TanjilG_14501 [Lupinus angustifolius]